MLRDPFNPRAYGVRVPDSYSLPTLTYHIRQPFVCTTDTNGYFEAIFMPNPMLTTIVGHGSIVGGTPFGSNASAGYLVSPSSFNTQALNYRVVGWGAKIIAKDSAFAERGRVSTAVIPLAGTQPAWETINTVQADSTPKLSQYIAGYEVGSATAFLSLLNFPTAQGFSVQDLLSLGSMTASITPSHIDQYRFRGLATTSSTGIWNIATTEFIEQGGAFNSAGAMNGLGSGSLDPTNLSGCNGLLVVGTGMPITSNEIDVDIILHFEVTPNIIAVSGSGNVLIPSSMDSAPGSTSLLESMLAAAKPYTDAFRTGAESAVNHLGTSAVNFGARAAVSTAMHYARGYGMRNLVR